MNALAESFSSSQDLFNKVIRLPGSLDQNFAKANDCQGELQRFGSCLYGSTPNMQQLYSMIEKVAPTNATVFIVGESGSGKELVATTIHEMSKRRGEPFVAVNCGAIPANLIEAELFGHEKGSFTGAYRQHKGCFERAGKGTLFLDEITEMPIEMQVRLLRVLETGCFSRVGGDGEIESQARIIAATNRDPHEAARENHLRQDLLYRLSVFPIHVPPLRQRGEDIIGLAEHFLAELNTEEGANKRLSRQAKEQLKTHSWAGNVRELKNAIQRAFIMATDELTMDGLLQQSASGHSVRRIDGCLTIEIGTPLAEAEKQMIYATLDHCRGNKRRAAEVLGLSLKTLYNRFAEYQVTTSSNMVATGAD